MSKLYKVSNIGKRVLKDLQYQRAKSFESKMEAKSDEDKLGRKMDLIGGMVIAWLIAAIILYQFVGFMAAYFAIIASGAYYAWSKKRNSRMQNILEKMRHEKNMQQKCFDRIMEASDQTIKSVIKDIIIKKTDYDKFQETGNNLPLIAKNEKDKALIYFDKRDKESEVNISELRELINLAEQQGAKKAVYITTGTFVRGAHDFKNKEAGFTLSLVNNDKLVQLLKEIDNPIYTEEKDVTAEKAKHGVKYLDKKEIKQNAFGEKKMAVKYLAVAAVLIFMGTILSGWMTALYYLLAAFNLFLAALAYMHNLPEVTEEDALI